MIGPPDQSKRRFQFGIANRSHYLADMSRENQRDVAKTGSFLLLHLLVGFTVAYALSGSLAIAGGIALIEPAVNAVAFFFHERAWRTKPQPAH